MIYPCYNCTERSLGCHTNCEKYQETKREYERLKRSELKSSWYYRDYKQKHYGPKGGFRDDV